MCTSLSLSLSCALRPDVILRSVTRSFRYSASFAPVAFAMELQLLGRIIHRKLLQVSSYLVLEETFIPARIPMDMSDFVSCFFSLSRSCIVLSPHRKISS